MEIKVYKTKQEVAKEFSKFLIAFVTGRKETHIALSGGSTPKIVFDELASNYNKEIQWEKVHLYWGDERCVPPEDKDSNYKMTVEHLISKITIPKENIRRIKGENNPMYEAKRYANLLKKELPKANNLPQFDLVILGMGDDGHTASIFPHQIDLWHSNKYCEVAIHPESDQRRVSITGQIINNATTVTFLVTGESKAAKFTEIKNKIGNYAQYPASLVAPSSRQLFWFLDQGAAGVI